MTRQEAIELRKPYQYACTRVWNAAQRNQVDLAMAMGFFTTTDWEQLAAGEISNEALDVVMADIACRPALRGQLKEEPTERRT